MNWEILRGKGIGDTSYMKNGDCWARHEAILVTELRFGLVRLGNGKM